MRIKAFEVNTLDFDVVGVNKWIREMEENKQIEVVSITTLATPGEEYHSSFVVAVVYKRKA